MLEPKVYDNGGRTFDRYSVLIGMDVFDMSHNAAAPNGVNMYAGPLAEFPADVWAEYVPVPLHELPTSTLQAINSRIEQIQEEIDND